jgi:hypothetical protein
LQKVFDFAHFVVTTNKHKVKEFYGRHFVRPEVPRFYTLFTKNCNKFDENRQNRRLKIMKINYETQKEFRKHLNLPRAGDIFRIGGRSFTLISIHEKGEDISSRYSEELGYDENLTKKLPVDVAAIIEDPTGRDALPSNDIISIEDLAELSRVAGEKWFLPKHVNPQSKEKIAKNYQSLSTKFPERPQQLIPKVGLAVKFKGNSRESSKDLIIEKVYPRNTTFTDIPVLRSGIRGTSTLKYDGKIMKTRYLLRDPKVPADTEVSRATHMMATISELRKVSSAKSLVRSQMLPAGSELYFKRNGHYLRCLVMDHITIGETYRDTAVYKDKNVWSNCHKDKNVYVSGLKPVSTPAYIVEIFLKEDAEVPFNQLSKKKQITVISAGRVRHPESFTKVEASTHGILGGVKPEKKIEVEPRV